MTACYMFDTYPNKDKLSLVVLPLAKEFLNNFNDIPIDFNPELKVYLDSLTKQFEISFDLSFFDSYENPSLWYIEILTDEELKKSIKQLAS